MRVSPEHIIIVRETCDRLGNVITGIGYDHKREDVQAYDFFGSSFLLLSNLQKASATHRSV